MAVGAFLFGTMSDIAGRKKLIPVIMGIIFCASAILSFAQANFLINLSVFLLGLGVAGNNIVLRVYFIECLPMRKRGTYLAVIDMFWMVGYLSALGVSWSMMPSVVRMLGKQFRPSSWRVLALVCGTPSLVIACISALLPPSPRYLLHRRRTRQALTVLQQMYAINNSKHADTYPIRDLEDCVRADDEDEADGIQRYFTKTWERLHRIRKPPYKRVTLYGILGCLLHFPGFAWLALWNTHILQEMENDHVAISGNGTCKVDVQSMVLDFLRNCDEVNGTRFGLLSLLSLGYVLGETLLIIGIDVIGRRPYLIFSGLVGGVASLILILRLHHAIRVTLSLIFLAAYAIGRTTTCVLLLENYPTALRGTMMGLTRILPHLTVFALQLFLRTTCLLSIIVASISLMGASIVMLLVPDLTRLPMKE
ncbi:synaptic vesicle glycoprotein 2B [Monomorium pharaonis]|uniref:synaptic vesicle glycoprotein 2B n=1 Tax=Monomorium pharaonis TaxID=307658 RepID=UPI00174736CB|nr:synaptic vesicle glycoprotein 2B [Monomorium pharaonis]